MILSRQIAAVAVVGVLLAGCTGDRGPDGIPGSPSPTRWGPALTYDEAYARIPLDGTDRVTLYWEVPDLEESYQGPVLAARRLQALDEHRYSQPTPHADAYLYQWLATERMIDIHYADGPPDPARTSRSYTVGPVWLRVLDVGELSDRRVRATICRDLGWRGLADGSIELPRHDRVRHWHYVVVERRGDDGEPHWLVDQVWADWDLVGPEVRRECEQWATHKPGEEA